MVLSGGFRLPADAAGTIETVLGPVPVETLGPTLIHEHVLVDFIGADRVSPSRYRRDEVIERMLPLLEDARAQGCRTLVDCTPAWLGRDATLLRDLSRASSLAILTTTGYYGAAKDKYLPPHVWTETADEIAARWTAEARRGIDGTIVKPGLIKIGVDASPLSPIDTKLVRAAGITHRATGLVIGSHTEDGAGAQAQLDVLATLGVDPSAFIWMHAQKERHVELHEAVAGRGAWVELDGVGQEDPDPHVALVMRLRDAGLLNQTLVSQDAGWYHVGEPRGGTMRPYTRLFERFLPALRKAGFTAAEKRQLIVENPHRALRPLREANARA
jgi:phosphotriesterase-related protein